MPHPQPSAAAPARRVSPLVWPQWLRLSWSWRITWIYLILVLFLPLGAMALKALAVGPVEFFNLATTPEALATYRITFGLSLVAALLNGVFGVVIAWALVRCRFPGQRLLDALIDLPFALPTAVAGLALAGLYSTNGWLGAPLQALFGLKVSFTWLGVAIAMVFISLPFVVRSVEPVLRAMEQDQEEAAWCLGASPRQTLLRVVLPQLMPAILSGMAQGYSRAVGEYGSVVMISSNVPFKDLITPTLIIQKLEEYDFASATVIGMVMLGFSLLSLLVINGLQVWGRHWEANPMVGG
jgi:sulfate transport system permease protein